MKTTVGSGGPSHACKLIGVLLSTSMVEMNGWKELLGGILNLEVEV